MKFLTFLFAVGFSFPVLAQPEPTDFHKAYGSRFQRRDVSKLAATGRPVDAVHRWNQVALDATGLDHTPVQPGENRVFGEQSEMSFRRQILTAIVARLACRL